MQMLGLGRYWPPQDLQKEPQALLRTLSRAKNRYFLASAHKDKSRAYNTSIKYKTQICQGTCQHKIRDAFHQALLY